MTPKEFLNVAVIPSLGLLPAKMDSAAARAMMVSIALQESALFYRRQKPAGPARGFFQFEKVAALEVLTNRMTATYALDVMERLCYRLEGDIVKTVEPLHAVLEHNDVLACVFARLFLWRLPEGLPGPTEAERAHAQYLKCWKPGKPDPSRWPPYYAQAWREVAGLELGHQSGV